MSIPGAGSAYPIDSVGYTKREEYRTQTVDRTTRGHPHVSRSEAIPQRGRPLLLAKVQTFQMNAFKVGA